MRVTEEWIVIFVNDKHHENNFFGVLWISPVISKFLIPSKICSSNDVTEEGIVICANDVHPSKACSPIEVTDDGIVICVNDLQE